MKQATSTLNAINNNESSAVQWKKISFENIDDVVPNVRGQRAFPSKQLAHCDPFVLLDHIGPQKMPDNFFVQGHMHPHRGFETITFMFEGNLHHQDNFGPRVSLSTGGVQKMNAGSGISHGGDMWGDEKTKRFHEVQLWVNSPAKHKMSQPEVNNFKNEDIPVIEKQGVKLRIIAGSQPNSEGKVIQGPVKTFANIASIHGICHTQMHGEQNVPLTLYIPEKHDKVVIYLLKGQLEVMLNDEPQSIAAFESLVINTQELSELSLTNMKGEFLFLSGQSLDEPVVMGGPFVMNNQAEIRQANNDYINGYFD